MLRNLIYGFAGLIIVFSFALLTFNYGLMLFAAVLGLMLVARQNAAPLRSFWARITARVPEAVPRTA